MAKKSTKTESGVVETDTILEEARKAYETAREAWSESQDEAKSDLKFARLGEQWDERIKQQRELEQRPCLTFNKMPAFIRQVVNDARQNKPAIKIHPQDSQADPRTAEILNGLIRNIEVTSDADVAYDTAIEHAVGQGFGFWRINTAYTCDDAFDQDIVIERVANPFTVYGDPRSTAGDSSDWNTAFVVTTMTKDEFEKEYPNAEKTDWDSDFRDCPDWLDGDTVTVAEYWTREKVKGSVLLLTDGTIAKPEEFEENAEYYQAMGVGVTSERDTETYKVTQRIMTGAEVLKTVEWAGKYIPIVPVYGDEVIDEDGKRHFRSLIRDAKSAQQMFNYMRTTGIEGLALQPRIPYIGEEKAFEIDPNWSTANSQSHPYLMIPNGAQPPQRQPLPSHYSAALQEALSAADDMKSIIGIYDASLGARSNETSGRAIMARQREGDVSTFHFIDNLSRAIRHGGRVLLDLIPKVYSSERMIRILGEDMKPANVTVAPGQPAAPEQDDRGRIVGGVFDLTAGKYDLTVSAGPSYTSRREEVGQLLMETMQALGPDSAPFLAPRLARVLDLPDAEELAAELEMLNPARQNQGIPPEVQQQMEQMQATIQQGGQQMQQLAQENEGLKADVQGKRADAALKMQQVQLEAQKLEVERFRAETERMKVAGELMKPTPAPRQPAQQ